MFSFSYYVFVLQFLCHAFIFGINLDLSFVFVFVVPIFCRAFGIAIQNLDLVINIEFL